MSEVKSLDLVHNWLSVRSVLGSCQLPTCINKVQTLRKKTTVTGLPPTLILVFDRGVTKKHGHVVKSDIAVHLDQTLLIPVLDPSSDIIHENVYTLTSFICHHGNSVNGGHFITSIVDEDSSGLLVIVCNDSKIAARKPMPTLSMDSSSKRDLYIAVYDRSVIVIMQLYACYDS